MIPLWLANTSQFWSIVNFNSSNWVKFHQKIIKLKHPSFQPMKFTLLSRDLIWLLELLTESFSPEFFCLIIVLKDTLFIPSYQVFLKTKMNLASNKLRNMLSHVVECGLLVTKNLVTVDGQRSSKSKFFPSELSNLRIVLFLLVSSLLCNKNTQICDIRCIKK